MAVMKEGHTPDITNQLTAMVFMLKQRKLVDEAHREGQ
jgi:hypothetical protein